ncbi:MAG: fibrobacter succinogenes major paralogous domain-containing protein [Odoribacter sp.]|nr:fibrobacter succinogenes major paralogous domain-containing protein [Odoribacter sp.]MDY3033129.1 fibrobacter succinogenes major paralogous domain-containing protein [Odoribacter sp.]
MRKIIFILLSVTIWWACEDNDEPIVGPEGVVSEFIDSRDGKVYKCVTIGGQTWMAENLAYRLPLGSIDGCYTYREEFVDTARIQPTDEDYFDEVRAALNDGRIGTDPLPEMPMFTPAKLVEMYLEYGLSSSMFVGMIKDAVAFYPSMRETADFLAGLAGEMKSVAIAQAVQKAMEKAEEQTRGYMEKYGLLYTYDGALKALPEGWKLPTDEDWKQLEETLGMSEHELNLLDEWRGATAGILLHDAKTGFNVNYAGTRAYGKFNYDSPFMNKDMNAYYWSSSRLAQTDSTEVAVIRTVSRVHDGILRGTSNMTAAYSIRCIKE